MEEISKAYMLLQIAERALNFPGLKHLHDQATTILKDLSLTTPSQPTEPAPPPLDPTAGTFGDPANG